MSATLVQSLGLNPDSWAGGVLEKTTDSSAMAMNSKGGTSILIGELYTLRARSCTFPSSQHGWEKAPGSRSPKQRCHAWWQTRKFCFTTQRIAFLVWCVSKHTEPLISLKQEELGSDWGSWERDRVTVQGWDTNLCSTGKDILSSLHFF